MHWFSSSKAAYHDRFLNISSELAESTLSKFRILHVFTIRIDRCVTVGISGMCQAWCECKDIDVMLLPVHRDFSW